MSDDNLKVDHEGTIQNMEVSALNDSKKQQVQMASSQLPQIQQSQGQQTKSSMKRNFRKNDPLDKQKAFEASLNDTGAKSQIIQSQQNMNSQLEMLDYKIAEILKNHEEDFLQAYLQQMRQVQNELKNLKKKISEEALKQKTDEKIHILEEEAAYFRAEALRLDKLCTEQQKTIEELNFKNKILNEDKCYYEGFVIETKKENKQLKNELLNAYVQNKIENFKLEKKQDNSQEEETTDDAKNTSKIQDQQLPTSNDLPSPVKNFFSTQPEHKQANFLSDQRQQRQPFLPTSKQITIDKKQLLKLLKQIEFLKENEEKMQEKINQLKIQLAHGSVQLKKYKADASTGILQRGQAEEILNDAIKTVKNNIIARKIASHITDLKSKQAILKQTTATGSGDIEYNQFTSKDKQY